MDVHHLRVFASVFKHRSFSKAGEELRLTQPTVSDHIRALEEELNCRLFDRLGRKIIPTKEAGVLIGKAQEIIEKLDGVSSLLGEFRKDLSGHLVIGASTIPATYILPGIISSFRKKHPSVLFEVYVSDSRGIADKVSEHELLIGIVGARIAGRHVQYTPFLEDELILIGAPSLVQNRTIGISDLGSLPMVSREEGSGTRKEFERILTKHGFDIGRFSIVAMFGSTDAVKQAVKEGMGFSIVSRRSVRDEIRCGFLKEVKIRDLEMKRHFYIVTHGKRSLPHLAKAFLESLPS